MRVRFRVGVIAALATLSLSLSGCANEPLDRQAGDGVSLTIGSTGNFADQVIAQTYGQALAADGYAIDYNTGVRSNARVLTSLKAGRIDIVPVDLGDMLLSVDPNVDPGDTASATSSLERAMESAKITVLTPAAAEDSVVFVTTKKQASADKLTDLNDVRSIVEPLTIASAASFDDAAYGRVPLQNAYGIPTWTALVTKTTSAALSALRGGQAQLALIPTTTAQLYSSDDLVVLGDPRNLIPPQNITPLARDAVANQEVGRVIDAISNRLTSGTVATFAGQSDELASTVAREWLERENLLSATG